MSPGLSGVVMSLISQTMTRRLLPVRLGISDKRLKLL